MKVVPKCSKIHWLRKHVSTSKSSTAVAFILTLFRKSQHINVGENMLAVLQPVDPQKICCATSRILQGTPAFMITLLKEG